MLSHLQGFLTPQRRERFEEVLVQRTRMVRVVLEDVYQPHNQSAVLRTAEALGLQDVHLVESSNRLKVDRQISMGSEAWLTIHRHTGDDDVASCLTQLQREGFRILAASPDPEASPLAKIVVERPTALVIGHETEGVSQAAIQLADECVVVPMRGFVESFNLSVAAAVALAHLRQQLETSDLDWRLTADEVDRLRLKWTRRSIPNVEAIERRFLTD